MTYELCTFPPALFELKGLLNEPQKATFSDALSTAAQNKAVSLPTILRKKCTKIPANADIPYEI